jgi:hypothetical protein
MVRLFIKILISSVKKEGIVAVLELIVKVLSETVSELKREKRLGNMDRGFTSSENDFEENRSLTKNSY